MLLMMMAHEAFCDVSETGVWGGIATVGKLRALPRQSCARAGPSRKKAFPTFFSNCLFQSEKECLEMDLPCWLEGRFGHAHPWGCLRTLEARLRFVSNSHPGSSAFVGPGQWRTALSAARLCRHSVGSRGWHPPGPAVTACPRPCLRPLWDNLAGLGSVGTRCDCLPEVACAALMGRFGRFGARGGPV